MIRHLVTNPCQDACGTVDTGAQLDGCTIFRCPGCDSTWVDDDEAAPAVTDHPADRFGAHSAFTARERPQPLATAAGADS